MEQNHDYNESIIADRRFHLQLAEFSENKFFLKAIRQVRDLCDLAGTWSLINKERKYEAQKEHEDLLEMIKSKSVEGSIEKMKYHLHSTCNKIVEKFNPKIIILFGSYVNGNPTPESDVDILVIFDKIRQLKDDGLSLGFEAQWNKNVR